MTQADGSPQRCVIRDGQGRPLFAGAERVRAPQRELRRFLI